MGTTAVGLLDGAADGKGAGNAAIATMETMAERNALISMIPLQTMHIEFELRRARLIECLLDDQPL